MVIPISILILDSIVINYKKIHLSLSEELIPPFTHI